MLKINEELKRAIEAGTHATTAGELLKDWGGDYERAEIHAANALGRLAREFTIKNGAVNSCKYHEGTRGGWFDFALSAAEARDIFGLAYTSSSDFAALWVCNLESVLSVCPSWTLRGVTINANFDPVFIFIEHDKRGNERGEIYKTDIQLYKFIEDTKTAQRVERLDNFTKSAYIVADAAERILTEYSGKAYGEKTREKIREELRAAAEPLGVCAWFGRSGLEVSATHNEFTKLFYFEYLTEENKIKAAKPYATKSEKSAKQANAEQKKLKEKIKKISAELLPLLEQYNDNERTLQRETKKSDIFRTDIYTIAKYGL